MDAKGCANRWNKKDSWFSPSILKLMKQVPDNSYSPQVFFFFFLIHEDEYLAAKLPGIKERREAMVAQAREGTRIISYCKVAHFVL